MYCDFCHTDAPAKGCQALQANESDPPIIMCGYCSEILKDFYVVICGRCRNAYVLKWETVFERAKKNHKENYKNLILIRQYCLKNSLIFVQVIYEYECPHCKIELPGLNGSSHKCKHRGTA